MEKINPILSGRWEKATRDHFYPNDQEVKAILFAIKPVKGEAWYCHYFQELDLPNKKKVGKLIEEQRVYVWVNDKSLFMTNPEACITLNGNLTPGILPA